MLIDTRALPTHIAKCAARLNAVGAENSADSFLITSYLAEVAIKTVAIALQVALRDRAPTHSYRIAYELVRADGLGSWDAAIRECTSEPLSGFISTECTALVAWATKKRTKPEDEWWRRAKAAATSVLRELGSPDDSGGRPQTSRELIGALVQIRNKTKAHGAVGPDFFAEVNDAYILAVRELITNCPAFEWEWLHLSYRDKGTVRGVMLSGEGPQHIRDADAARFRPDKAGVHILPGPRSRPLYCGELLRSNREYSTFAVPNGGYDGKGRAEFIDYGSGSSTREDVGSLVAPPVLPPASETQGNDALDVQGNVLANLPAMPRGYVERPTLEAELYARLVDRNHAIVTLHGRGGVGKTMLALNAAHRLSREQAPRFDSIVWFSARDVDLRPSGPAFVRPDVIALEDVAAKYAKLVGGPRDIEAFAQALQTVDIGGNGTLFIFDNFETMASISDLHRFLDTHTHLPNKTLLTSRERAFKADYPIEVKGMEYGEAETMLRAVARDLSIEGLATDDVIQSIYDHTEGHAYLMRVVMGEVAKEGRYVPPRQLVSRRIDIVDAVFERSFEKLSDAGRFVFLAVSNWKSAVPAIALAVTLGDLDLDVEAGIDECIRLSLLSRDFLVDGHPCYTAPLLARMFGQKKLVGDPDRLIIQEQLEAIRRFGVIDVHQAGKYAQRDATDRFVAWCCEPKNQASLSIPADKLDRMLLSLADLWAPGWLALAKFREQCCAPRQQVEQAYRRAVEEMPDNREAWLERARYAGLAGDETTRISSLISAVEADPTDVDLAEDVAGHVTRYITDNSAQITGIRRGVYIAGIRDTMVRLASKLDADGLSRLSWLFLLEGNEVEARKYAELGLKFEPHNPHCWRIVSKLSS